MEINALGLIEVIGYPTVIEAADAALKAANVQLGGIVKVDGGIMTAQILGDVGAVKAAVEVGGMAASKVGKVRATHVIPRVDASLFGKVIKFTNQVNKAENISSKPNLPSGEVESQEKISEAILPLENNLEDSTSLHEVEAQEKIQEATHVEEETIASDAHDEVVKRTEKEWSNMSNKELRALIASLGIQIPDKKLKSAKKEELIGILKDFYKA